MGDHGLKNSCTRPSLPSENGLGWDKFGGGARTDWLSGCAKSMQRLAQSQIMNQQMT